MTIYIKEAETVLKITAGQGLVTAHFRDLIDKNLISKVILTGQISYHISLICYILLFMFNLNIFDWLLNFTKLR